MSRVEHNVEWFRRLFLRAPNIVENTGKSDNAPVEGGHVIAGSKFRSSLWRMAFVTIAFLWPAILNGGAFPFPDTVSYVKGGAFAVDEIEALLNDPASIFNALFENHVSTDAVMSEADAADSANSNKNKNIVGMRSPTYSLYAYITNVPFENGILIVAGQAAMVAFVMTIFLRALAPTLSALTFVAIVAMLALLTTAPWYGSFAMPDVLGAAAVLTMALFLFYPERLSLFEKSAAAAISAFAVTAHPSNVLLVAAIAGLGGLERLIRDYRAGERFALKPYCWIAAPLTVGLAAMLIISLLGFGEASVTPKRFPFALARSISDGPGLWHLEKHCDTYKYTVCEVFDEIPQGVGEFLWEETGLRYRATPEQLDRIRKEEMTIVMRAAREYPMVQIRKAAFNTYRQIVRVGLPGIRFGNRIERTDNGDWRVRLADPKNGKFIQPLESVQAVIIYLSLGLLAYFVWQRRKLGKEELRVIILIGGALLANAVICGVLSGPANRYQGRLIWLLPMLAAALFAKYKVWKSTKLSI